MTPTGSSRRSWTECSGVVEALACTETAVPAGAWRYTVTPVLDAWTGSPSLESAAAVTSSATLTLASSIVSELPATLDGTVSGFVNGESLTFHLDSPSGPVLVGTPASVPTGGSTDITVTIPVGTDNSPHSVFAVGDAGTLASHAITVLDPPVLTATRALRCQRQRQGRPGACHLLEVARALYRGHDTLDPGRRPFGRHARIGYRQRQHRHPHPGRRRRAPRTPPWAHSPWRWRPTPPGFAMAPTRPPRSRRRRRQTEPRRSPRPSRCSTPTPTARSTRSRSPSRKRLRPTRPALGPGR